MVDYNIWLYMMTVGVLNWELGQLQAVRSLINSSSMPTVHCAHDDVSTMKCIGQCLVIQEGVRYCGLKESGSCLAAYRPLYTASLYCM